MNKTSITSVAALLSQVMNTTSGKICRIVTKTIPQMNKRNNPFYGRVEKLVEQSAQIGYNYGRVTNAHLEKVGAEPTFEVAPRTWGTWVSGAENKILTHNGSFYIAFNIMENNNCKVMYLLDGKPATAEETAAILEWVKSNHYSAKQAEAGLTNAADQVRPMDYKVENILSMKVDGWEYVKQGADALAYIAA